MLRTFAAVVVGAAIAVAAPFVFVILAIVGLQPFEEEDTLAWVIVLLLSFLVGLASFLAAGAVTYSLTHKRWLIPAPYALGGLLFVAGLLLT